LELHIKMSCAYLIYYINGTDWRNLNDWFFFYFLGITSGLIFPQVARNNLQLSSSKGRHGVGSYRKKFAQVRYNRITLTQFWFVYIFTGVACVFNWLKTAPHPPHAKHTHTHSHTKNISQLVYHESLKSFRLG